MRWSNTRITKRNLQEMMKRARKNKKSFWRILLTRKLKRLMKRGVMTEQTIMKIMKRVKRWNKRSIMRNEGRQFLMTTPPGSQQTGAGMRLNTDPTRRAVGPLGSQGLEI